MESADGSPPGKKAKLYTASVDEVPNSLLAKIFAYLPLKDRHQLCLVSSTWAAASRIPWSDVTFLDLSTIPRGMIESILALCPMLQELCAKDVTINLEMKANQASSVNLHTMKLHGVKLVVSNLSDIKQCSDVGGDPEVSLRFYFRRFPKLTDLTWHDVTFITNSAEGSSAAGADSRVPSLDQVVLLSPSTIASIRRLIMITTSDPANNEKPVYLFLIGMINLECLYSLDRTFYLSASLSHFDLPNLREMCLSGVRVAVERIAKALSAGKFQKLEVLIVASQQLQHDQISQLLQACSALRILVIAGQDKRLANHHRIQAFLGEPITPVILPAPAVSDRSSSQPLQIFVGGDFTNRVRFTIPKKSELANFWRIDCPMAEYLAKPDVAEIFKDVWVAKVIREGPENGLLPLGHPNEMNLFYSTSPLSFC